jgi:hypothetical protein
MCLNQQKTKSNISVVCIQAEIRAQTENHYSHTDDTTHTDQQSSQDQSQIHTSQ